MSIAIDNGMTLFVIGCGSSKWYDLIIDIFHRKKCTNCFVISLCPNQYHGNEHDRARDLFYGLWIPDLFMKRVKENGKWYLKPEPIDLDLPPDQLYSNNKTAYFNQGRKRITTEQTHHEDVLKQPVLEIIEANFSVLLLTCSNLNLSE